MQKKLIALAIAGLGLSGAAFAQTNVTIYGILDATLDSVKADGASGAGANLPNYTRIQSNSSYVGFKGTEDLGDGMSAIFQWETGFNTDTGVYGVTGNTGVSAGSGRDTFVGLKGGFGTVKLGTLTGPTRAIGTTLDVLPGRTGIGTVDALLGKPNSSVGVGRTEGLFDTRTANTISYTTPNMSGFSATVNYAAAENRTNSTAAAAAQLNGHLWELGLNYANGPWYAAFAYGKMDAGANSVAAAGTVLTQTSDRLGLGYTFEGGHKLNFIWDKQKQDLAASKDLERSGWSLQGLYKVTPTGGLVGSYTKVNNASGNFLATNNDTEAKMVTVGYLYSLSKRTTIKALYSRITNANNAAYDFTGAGNTPVTGVGTSAVGAGADPQGYSIGLRHAF